MRPVQQGCKGHDLHCKGLLRLICYNHLFVVLFMFQGCWVLLFHLILFVFIQTFSDVFLALSTPQKMISTLRFFYLRRIQSLFQKNLSITLRFLFQKKTSTK